MQFIVFYALALGIRDGKSDFDIDNINAEGRGILSGKIISLDVQTRYTTG